MVLLNTYGEEQDEKMLKQVIDLINLTMETSDFSEIVIPDTSSCSKATVRPSNLQLKEVAWADIVI